MQDQLRYPWEPHKTIHVTEHGLDSFAYVVHTKTREEAVIAAKRRIMYHIDTTLSNYINDLIHLGIQNAFKSYYQYSNESFSNR